MADGTLTIAVFNETASWVLPDEHVSRIEREAPDGIVVRQVMNRTDLVRVLPETDYLFGFPLTEELVMHQAPRLKWAQMTNSPGDALAPVLAALRRGVRISSAASIRAPQVAEHAAALVLALMRRLDVAIRTQDEHRWATFEIAADIRTLMGSTAGIIAVGAVGQEIAQRLKAFGVRVLATRRNPGNPYLHVDEMLGADELPDLMRRSDIVIVATPKLPTTMGLIGKKELALMKPTAVLVDVSRGGVVNDAALLEALRRRKIGGAGLDVFDSGPLPTDSQWWTMPNVIVTPHVASASPGYWSHATEVLMHNMRRLVEQRPLVDEVTLEWLENGSVA